MSACMNTKRRLTALAVSALMVLQPGLEAAGSGAAVTIAQKRIGGGASLTDYGEYPPMQVFGYRDGQVTVRPVERIVHDGGRVNTHMAFDDERPILYPTGAKAGRFLLYTSDRRSFETNRDGTPNLEYESGGIWYCFNALDGEGPIVPVNLSEAFGEEHMYSPGQPRKRHLYSHYMMRNGQVAARKENYEITVMDPDTLTEVPLRFDYGEVQTVELGGETIRVPQYAVLAAEYSPAREQYIVLYYQSPYVEGSAAEGLYNHRHSWAGIALFDKSGRQVANHRLDGLNFVEPNPLGGGIWRLTVTRTPMLVADDTGEVYIWGLTKREYVKAVYDEYQTDWLNAESSNAPHGTTWDVPPGTCYAKVSLDTGVYEVVDKAEYLAQAVVGEFPFTIELRSDGTYILDKENPAGPPLAFLEGDYMPVDYAVNSDDSWQVVFASDLSASRHARHPYNLERGITFREDTQ